MRNAAAVMGLLALLAVARWLPVIRQQAERERQAVGWSSDYVPYVWFSVGMQVGEWASPYALGENLTAGMGEPLASALGYPDEVLRLAVGRVLGWERWTTMGVTNWLLWVARSLLAALAIALLQGGIYGWIVMRVRDGEAGRDTVWDHVRGNVLPLFWWRALLAGLGLLTWVMPRSMSRWWGGLDEFQALRGVKSFEAVVIAVLALTPFILVSERSRFLTGLFRGLRLVAARWPTMLALLVVSRLMYAAVGVIQALTGFRPAVPWAAGMGGAGGFGVGLASAFVAELVWAAVALSLCVACMLLVVRTAGPTDGLRQAIVAEPDARE
jgi:hypothetical protein